MELNEYQSKAMRTRMATCNDVYMLLNLAAEVGELTGKVAKAIRKDKTHIDPDGEIFYPNYKSEEWVEFEKELKAEAGDILWQLAGFCECMKWKLDDIAQLNLDKLADRAQRGVIDGTGDTR